MQIGFTKVVGGFAVMAGDSLLGVVSSEKTARTVVEIAKRYEVVVSQWRRQTEGTGAGFPVRQAQDEGGNVPVRTDSEG